PGQPLLRNTAGFQQINEPVPAQARGDLLANTSEENGSERAGCAFHASTLPGPAASGPYPQRGARTPRSSRRSGPHVRNRGAAGPADTSVRSGCAPTQMAIRESDCTAGSPPWPTPAAPSANGGPTTRSGRARHRTQINPIWAACAPPDLKPTGAPI